MERLSSPAPPPASPVPPPASTARLPASPVPPPASSTPPAAATTLAERFAAQLLVGAPARDPLAVAARLLAVQGQDPRGARLAIRARSTGLTAGAVDAALTEDRSLLITWLNRGTLHLVASEDYHWLHALTTPPLLTGSARRLAQEGLTSGAADRGVHAIERALTTEGPLTRRQLAERIASAGVHTAGQALVHLLMLAALRGLAVRGPMVGREHAYALVSDWLGPPPRLPGRDVMLAELARRYLAGHGPADARDLAKWAGLPLRDARAGFAAIASELEERTDGTLALAGRGPAVDAPRRRRPVAGVPSPRLLGPYDPILLGWISREALLGCHREIVTTNGLFRPFALVKGRAAGIWRLRAHGVRLEPFGPIASRDAAALRADARDVARFMGHRHDATASNI